VGVRKKKIVRKKKKKKGKEKNGEQHNSVFLGFLLRGGR
jgi:hypothetical protein